MFLALIGLLLPLLFIVLFAVNHQTDTQVTAFRQKSITRARAAFTEAERSNRGRLEGIGQHFAASVRVTALIHNTLFEHMDTALIANELKYEAALAKEDSALVAFTDMEGKGIGGIERGVLLRDPAAAVPELLLDSMFARVDTAGFGYQLLGGRLYSVYVALARVNMQPNGFVIVGRPIDDAMARSIGDAVEGQVCFVAGAKCVARTSQLAGTGLTDSDMIEATRNTNAASQHTLKRAGKRWLLLADPLVGGAGWRVIARPIDDVLKPFEDIRRALIEMAIFAIILAPIVAVFLAGTLARPIRALVTATARVAQGDFTTRVPVTSQDELGRLSTAFNDMTHGLQQKEIYRGLLDKVISPEIADEMLKSDVALGGENRDVTILFADIRGFTPFTEAMEPQDVIRVLNELMEVASAIVDREGGVVDKYIGDEIMALFGAPVSHGDDALRAVRAALGIRDAIARLSAQRMQRGEPAVSMGIGINTGMVVAGNMGSEKRLNYTVLGRTVNVAARLCSDAATQEVLVGESTWERVRDHVLAESGGLRKLKGLSEPMATYSVHSLRDAHASVVAHT